MLPVMVATPKPIVVTQMPTLPPMLATMVQTMMPPLVSKMLTGVVSQIV